ncbi:MAG: UvrD-helicase domain-containing protein, partial [Thermotaleaceae bacterium]
MNAKEHPDYQEENIHLKETIGWIQEEEKFLQDYDEILKSEIADIRKTVITLMDERLVAKLQLHQIAEKDMGQLKKAKENPYFGRIDFQERRREDMDSIYIGKHGFMDKDRDIPVVVDWRAPIADVYYSGHSKEVSYRAPYGEVSGTMHLKRRYEIENGVLQNIYEEKTSETIIEESLQGKGAFLVEALNKSTQGRLKEIVATIQDQQNRIIRSEMSKPLVVQGVAGSGKTTIALHRMAYLIYNNRRNIEEAQYLVIAPNKLFLHYISDILPDLGVENVIQTTFEDWAIEQIGIPISTEGWVDPLNSFIQGAGEEWEQIKLIGRIKGSLLFKKVLDNSLQQWQESLLPKEDLTFEDIQLISYKKLQEIFLTSNVHLSLNERIERLGLYLKNRLRDNMTEYQQKIGDFYQRKIEDLKREAESLEEIRQNIIALYDERDRRLSTIKEELGGVVDRYV